MRMIKRMTKDKWESMSESEREDYQKGEELLQKHSELMRAMEEWEKPLPLPETPLELENLYNLLLEGLWLQYRALGLHTKILNDVESRWQTMREMGEAGIISEEEIEKEFGAVGILLVEAMRHKNWTLEETTNNQTDSLDMGDLLN